MMTIRIRSSHGLRCFTTIEGRCPGLRLPGETSVPRRRVPSTLRTKGSCAVRINATAAAVAPASPPPPPPCLLPPATYAKISALGGDKAALPTGKLLLLAVLAGVYIGFGCLLAMSIGGACPGLAQSNPGLQKLVLGTIGLPMGLLMVLICGAELFPGNAAFLTAAWLEEKASFAQVLRNWVLCYTGNLLGALLLAKIVSLSGLLLAAAAPLQISAAKTSLTFVQAFTRGLLANWLVCVAIWQATAAASLPGKVLGVILPISAFVSMGMENSVANMFIIPMGMLCGADITVKHFLLSNLLPVTLGNLVGGALCMAVPYSLAFGRSSQLLSGRPQQKPLPGVA